MLGLDRIKKLLNDHPRLYINIREPNDDIIEDRTFDEVTLPWYKLGEMRHRITFSPYTDAYMRYKHPITRREPWLRTYLKEEREYWNQGAPAYDSEASSEE